jgi:hypothetical protein
MKVQIERSLQEAGAISLSAGLSRPHQRFWEQPEAGHGRQESYAESATIPCADHCKASLILWRAFGPNHADLAAVAQNLAQVRVQTSRIAYQRSAKAA